MPTGYTYKVMKGEITELDEFAFECARAFLAVMRDAPSDEPLPDEIKVEQYYYDDAEEAKAAMDKFLNATEEEKQKMWVEYVEDTKVSNGERIREGEEVKARYEAMVEKVGRWSPPSSDHHELKKFMLHQLSESLKFDVHDYKDRILSYEKWKDVHGEYLIDTYNRRAEELEKRIARASKETRWIKQLKESF